MSDKVYFWQEGIWSKITSFNIRNTKGSVFLFSGLKGYGKIDFAMQYSKWLLCENIESEKKFLNLLVESARLVSGLMQARILIFLI